MMVRKYVGISACCLILLHVATAFAADPKTFNANWVTNQAKSGPDAVQHKEGGTGWFTNLGPTGIRAMLTDKAGKTLWEGSGTQYIVKYVFPDAPAAGKVLPGDIIVGVNNKPFQNVYKFGYWFGIGYEGPMLEVGRAIEESEAKLKGKISFMVVRRGQRLSVPVQMKSLGAFSSTFPKDCKKSAVLRQDAIKYLLKDTSWHGSGYPRFICTMALMAQGAKYHSKVEKHLDSMARQNIDDGTWHWGLAFSAIAMSEYQMVTGSKKYMGYMKRIDAQYKRNTTRYGNGTFGHVGLAEGTAGYGPMCGLTSLVVASWIMMEKAGVPIDKKARDVALTELDMEFTQKDGGGYGYGWGPDTRGSRRKLDPQKVSSTLVKLDQNISKFSNNRSAGITHGFMSINHTLYPWQKYSAGVAAYNVNKIARSRRCIVNGHGSGMLHAWSCFSGLGMAYNLGNKKPLRLTLDYSKAYINAARCHDGSFYTQPQRDDLGSDLGRASRTLPTALWAMVMSIPDKELQILGSAASIVPGVNCDTLTGNPAAAYKLIKAKKYSAAVKKLTSQSDANDAASPAGLMLAFIDKSVDSTLATMQERMIQGEWYGLQPEVAQGIKSYGGIAKFDKKAAEWMPLLTSKPGKLLVAAGQSVAKGAIGKADASLAELLTSAPEASIADPAKAYKKSLEEMTAECVEKLENLYTAGEWSLLKKGIIESRKGFAGIRSYDTKSLAWATTLKSTSGMALIKAHELHLKSSYGSALAASNGLGEDANPDLASAAKKLSEAIKVKVKEYVMHCEVMMAQGQWNTLKSELTKSRSKFKGAPLFDKSCANWDALLKTPAGLALISTDKNLQSGKVGSAAKALGGVEKDKAATEKVKAIAKVVSANIETSAVSALAPLLAYEKEGDWYALSESLKDAKKNLGGVPSFDEKYDAWKKKLRSKDVKSSLKAGKEFEKLEKKWQKKKGKGERKELQKFAEKYEGTLYAEKAKALLK